MTSNGILPEEVLRLIFSNFQLYDLLECKKVCKNWYSPAHCMLLEEVNLLSISAITKFVVAMSQNPNLLYLKAVKKINVSVPKCAKTHQLHPERLFSRFSNLKEVKLCCPIDMISGFNKDVCQAILRNCPKLEQFNVFCEEKPAYYFHLLYNVHPLLTTMDMKQADYREPFQGHSFVEYITCFPRLQRVHGYYGPELNTIKKHLLVFEKLPDLDCITLGRSYQKDFAEDYLNSRTVDVRNLLLKKLANVRYFEVLGDFSPSSMKFAFKYMTGLKKINLGSFSSQDWDENRLRVFHGIVLEMIRDVNDTALTLQQTFRSTLAILFPTILQKLFYQLPPNDKATTQFTLYMTGVRDYEADEANLLVRLKGHNRHITVASGYYVNLDSVVSDLLGANKPTIDVDIFRLRIDKGYTRQKLDILMYKKILQGLTKLKKVILDIPDIYKELAVSEAFKLGITRDITRIHPQVETLSIRATPRGKFESLLHHLSLIVPNLKYLEFYYFSGIWNGFIGEFQVGLPNFTLQKLAIDVTLVKRKTEMLSKHGFFVIVVETLSTFDRQAYKVQLNPILPIITRIEKSDLCGYTLGVDFTRVNITVKELQCLEVFFYNKDDLNDNYGEHQVTRLLIPVGHIQRAMVE